MIQYRAFRRRKTPSRRGVVLLVCMVCLLLCGAVVAAMVSAVAVQKTVVRQHGKQLQADWLAQAGLQRGLAALRSDPDYQGETWSPSTAEAGTAEDAVVVISVSSPADAPQMRQVRVQVDLVTENQRRLRTSKQLRIKLPTLEETP